MRSLGLFAAVAVALALLAGPASAQCSTACPLQQSYAAPQAFVVPQAVAVPAALFVVPSAPTVQLQVQQYSYAQPQVLVQPVVQKQVVQKIQVQKIQQVRQQPQRLRSVTRTRLFSR